jgi:SAM-dependent methyltransferase
LSDSAFSAATAPQGRPNARRQRFLADLRRPPGRTTAPPFDHGWHVGPESVVPFLSYLDRSQQINWSETLEGLHQAEATDHFLDRATREAVLAALEPTDLPEEPTVVDLGCSSGAMLADLSSSIPGAVLAGLDAVDSGLPLAHRAVPSALLFHADVTDLPFGDGSVDALVALNLLEHVSDDSTALAEVRRVLRPAGRAVLVVPFNPGLYDEYDSHLEHERRYARGELARKARSAGLNVQRDTYVGCAIYPAFWAVKKLGRLRQRDLDRAQAEELVRRRIRLSRGSRLGAAASRLELRLQRRGVPLPFGIRELLVAERG